MKIMVAAVMSSSEMSGVQRHAFNTVRCLLLRPEISAVHLVVGPWQHKLVQSVGLEIGWTSGRLADHRLTVHLAQMDRGSVSRNLWYYRGLPLLAAQLKVDLVHLAYPVPVNRSAFQCPTVVTLHDLYPYEIPANFGWRQVLFNRLILRQCLGNVDAIACVSQITSLRLQQYAPHSIWRKSTCISNCVEANTIETPLQRREAAPVPIAEDEPFLLCVAQHRRNKNIPVLLRAMADLLRRRLIDRQMRLMIVGISGPDTSRIRGQIARSGLTGRVHLLEGLSEGELQWCYRRCAVLVAPSSTEGFGLPVAEGLLAGCHIVCTDIPAFREVSRDVRGGYCRFVPLSQSMEEPLAQAIAEAMRTPAPAPTPLPQFSAAKLASQYFDLYRELITSPSSLPSSPVAVAHCDLPQETLEGRPVMTAPDPREVASVLGIQVDAIDMQAAIARLLVMLRDSRKGFVCVTGVHGVMEAQRHSQLREVFVEAAMNIPDGMPLVWVGHFQGKSHMRRVTGPDLMLELFARREFANVTHFLYGGKEGIAEELRSRLKQRFPWVNILGTYTPPFRDLNSSEEKEFIARIDALKPDIIWVGISCPRQELFMARYLPVLETKLMFGVGAAFDYHTGRIRDCSEWIKHAGLQWLHRLMQDPRRLWRRYLRNNPSFIWHIAWQLLGMRRHTHRDEIAESQRGAEVRS